MTKTTQGLSPALILLMSVATGLAVASNYYAQPLLDTIARAFNLSASSAGFIVTAAQLGYAAGLLFLVPLGDMFERRMLIVSMTLLAAGGMLITASSQSLTMMIIGTALTGLFSVVAQILVPLAATLASPEKRGKVVGTIMSGLLLGILLARTVAGLLASLGGWRTVYWVASVLMVVMALALWRGLPKVKQENHLNYPQLLASVFSLFTQDKLLRTRALLGCLTFANFSILWTSMAFLLAAPPFNYSEGVIGLFGLAGAAGALGARPAGGLADKGKSHMTTTAGMVLLLLSWAAIWYGHVSVLALIVGTALTGLFSVVAQILVPLAATLASPEKRGKVVGTIMSGLLLGILLARTVAGLLASLGGWRTVYWVASVLMVIMALALWRGLPKVKQENHLNYPQLLASVFSLFTQDKLLRTRALLGCFTFANFSILWTSMAFLLAAPPFNYSEGVIGLFGLAGAAGALGARPAGGLADKGKSHLTTSAGLVLLLLSWAAIWYGHISVLALIVGILVLDLTVQGVHITNQTVIYRVKPEARNRLTAGYMTSYFIGGAAGSLISASAWQHAGWSGVCAIGAIVATLNLLVWWRGYHRQDAIH